MPEPELQLQSLRRIASRCARTSGMDGSAIALSTDRVTESGMAASGLMYLKMQESEALTGEGPGIAAVRDRAMVQVGDFGATLQRWPIYAPIAVGAGINSAIALPLGIANVNVGVLVLYNNAPTKFAPSFLTKISSLGVETTRSLLKQSESGAYGPDAPIDDDKTFRSVVHQATGMVAAQLDIDVTEALVRLRAFAYASDQSVNAVAALIIRREVTVE